MRRIPPVLALGCGLALYLSCSSSEDSADSDGGVESDGAAGQGGGGTIGGPLGGQSLDASADVAANVPPGDAAAADASTPPDAPAPDAQAPDAAPALPMRDPRCEGAPAETMSGTGTDGDPYLLCWPTHLRQLGTGVHTLDKAYALGDDLDVTALEPALTTIGTPMMPLSGTFDGRNHKVTGVEVPLFHGVAAGAAVVNLQVTGAANASMAAVRWGLVAISNLGTVKNVHVFGTFSLPSHAGLLIGANEGMLESSTSSGVISQGGSHVGGLVGVNTGTIRRCGSRAEVNGVARVGGLVGRQSAPGVIEESYAIGKVKGNLSVGGLVGTLFGGVVRNSYARSPLVEGPQAGGLVGIISGTSADGIVRTISHCHAASVVSGQAAQGLVGAIENDPMYTVTGAYFLDTAAGNVGTALSAAQMKLATSFPGWDFDGIWQLKPALSEFPSLRFETAAP